jgi:hypothetical protein
VIAAHVQVGDVYQEDGGRWMVREIHVDVHGCIMLRLSAGRTVAGEWSRFRATDDLTIWRAS